MRKGKKIVVSFVFVGVEVSAFVFGHLVKGWPQVNGGCGRAQTKPEGDVCQAGEVGELVSNQTEPVLLKNPRGYSGLSASMLWGRYAREKGDQVVFKWSCLRFQGDRLL